MASLRMARRFTRGGAARLALTVLAVAWGVALVAAVRLANHAVLRAFVEVIDTMAGRAALEVGAGDARGRGGCALRQGRRLRRGRRAAHGIRRRPDRRRDRAGVRGAPRGRRPAGLPRAP